MEPSSELVTTVLNSLGLGCVQPPGSVLGEGGQTRRTGRVPRVMKVKVEGLVSRHLSLWSLLILALVQSPFFFFFFFCKEAEV